MLFDSDYFLFGRGGRRICLFLKVFNVWRKSSREKDCLNVHDCSFSEVAFHMVSCLSLSTQTLFSQSCLCLCIALEICYKATILQTYSSSILQRLQYCSCSLCSCLQYMYRSNNFYINCCVWQRGIIIAIFR